MPNKLFLVILLCLLVTSAAFSQTHFTFTRNTGNQGTVAVPLDANPTIGDSVLVAGDEIGVFTPAGLCVGAGVWRGDENIAITIWGNNTQTEVIDGILPGEVIHYRIWRRSTDTEYTKVRVEYSIGDSIYQHNGVYALSSIYAEIVDTTNIGSPQLIEPDNDDDNIPLGVIFNWLRVQNADFYQFQLADSVEFEVPLIDVDNLTDTTYSVNDLNTFTGYFWRVRGGRSDSYGPWSDIFFFTTIRGIPVVESISPDSGSISDTLEITFTGDNFYDDITQIEADTGIEILSFSVIEKTVLAAVIEITPSATEGDNFFRLINTGPGGGTSDPVRFYVIPFADTTISAPQLIAPENTADTVDVDPVFRWHPADLAESYRFQLATSVNFDSLSTEITGLTDTTLSVEGLATYTEYYWRVRGERVNIFGPWSEIFSFTTVPGIPIIESIEPDSGSLSERIEVIFTGENYFEGITKVDADTGLEVVSTIVTSREELIAVIDITAAAGLGVNTLRLENDAPGGGISNSVTFYVTPLTHTISGRVTNIQDATGLGRVLITASGEYESDTMTDSTGYYELVGILYGTEGIVLKAARLGFEFTPDSILIDDPVQSDIANIDFTGERVFYIISASSGENGIIVPEGPVFVDPDMDQTFTFIPDPGYAVDYIVIDGDTVGREKFYEFSDVSDDHTIHVEFRRVGDILSDGRVDIADLTAFIDHILGNLVLSGGAFVSADIDTNDVLDIRDAILLRDALLGRSTTDSTLIVPDDDFRPPGNYSDNITANLEATKEGLHFSLSNDVPVKGLTIVLRLNGGIQTGEGPRYIDDRSENMQILTQIEHNTMRIIVYNWENIPIDPGVGLIFGLPFTVPETGNLEVLRITASIGVDSLVLHKNISVNAIVQNRFTPIVTALSDNFPNPFNSSTQIQYEVPELNGGDSYYLVQIFSLLGEKVKTLAKGHHEPGVYTVTWDGTDSEGHRVASGIYIYRIWNPRYHSAKRMVLVK
jgi:hypothetical protein